MIKISAVLLAAGLSKRMGEDKLLLNYLGNPMLQQSVNLLSELPVFERILVTSDARIKQIVLPPGIRFYSKPSPESGQSSSIRVGIDASSGTHYLFISADQPKLSLTDLLPLIESATENPDKIIFPTIDSQPNSPTLFPAKFRTELLNLSGDSGGRTIRDANPELCLSIEPEYPDNFIDIDSEEDFIELIKGEKQ